MDRSTVLGLPDDADTAARVRDLVQADPVALVEIAAAIGDGKGAWPAEAVTRAAREEAASIATADAARVHDAIELAITGREVDLALEWMHQAGLLEVLMPEVAATVNLVQEEGRLHKDVWAHTKQVVKQSVRRPHVRWAALFHDIGKVPTRTFTDKGVHFHGHAEVGARMFDKIAQRIQFDREERRTIRFLVKHHLRSNQYSDTWSDSAVRRFHREMALHLTDLLDLSRADITSKRPGRRKQLLEQISARAGRVETLAEADAKLPPLPSGVGTAIMETFRLPPSKLVGDLKKLLEGAVARGDLEARREDGYYLSYLARAALVPGVTPEETARILASLPEPPPDAEREPDDHDGDPDRPREGALDCASDTEHQH
jgi:poly(A) polymerase